MKTKIHIQVFNFIRNPYVVRVDHGDTADLLNFRKLLRLAKNNTATWGYSNPEMEYLNPKETASTPNVFNFSFPTLLYRSYWIFSDDTDALSFRLSAGENAKQVYMWPKSVKFTITEFLENAGST